MRRAQARLVRIFLALAFWPLIGANAFGEKPALRPVYAASVSANESYSFSDGATFPSFDATSISSSAAISATFDKKWVVGLQYIDSRKDGEGWQADAGLDTKKPEGCPLDDTFGCTFSIALQQLQSKQTNTLTAGLSKTIRVGKIAKPYWSITGKTITGSGDNDTTLGLGVTLPYDVPTWFTVKATAAEVYSFGRERALPIWGVEISFKLAPKPPSNTETSLSVGYSSRLVQDSLLQELDVKRKATASLKIKF